MRFLLPVLVGAVAVFHAFPVHAVNPPVPGTRALGMGGALRGSATGDTALTLNPSGMSLMRAYAIEGAYAYDDKGTGAGSSNVGRISIVDSTSGFNIGGGVYYNFIREAGRTGHEGGLALSIPFGQVVYIGGTLRYLRLGEGAFAGSTRKSAFTFDVGLTVRPVSSLSIGVVGQNLTDPKTSRAPRLVGGGVTVGAVANLLLSFDAVMTWPSETAGGGRKWDFQGGAEYLFAQQFAVRAGGGRRGQTEAGFLAAGASYIAQLGAIDFGFQRDLSGALETTLVGVSARLFLPSPE